MTSVLGMNTAKLWQEIALDFRTLSRQFFINKYAPSELAMVQFTQRQVLLICLLSFLAIVIHC